MAAKPFVEDMKPADTNSVVNSDEALAHLREQENSLLEEKSALEKSAGELSQDILKLEQANKRLKVAGILAAIFAIGFFIKDKKDRDYKQRLLSVQLAAKKQELVALTVQLRRVQEDLREQRGELDQARNGGLALAPPTVLLPEQPLPAAIALKDEAAALGAEIQQAEQKLQDLNRQLSQELPKANNLLAAEARQQAA